MSGPVSLSSSRMHTLFNGFRIWKCPGSVQDLLLRLIQPHDVIPARHDRQEVGLLGVAPEVDSNTSVFVLLCSDVVEGVGVVLVDRHPALVVVERHRPEGVHRHVLHGEGVGGLPVVLFGEHVHVRGGLCRQPAPAECGPSIQ